jgi:hypothetical protein
MSLRNRSLKAACLQRVFRKYGLKLTENTSTRQMVISNCSIILKLKETAQYNIVYALIKFGPTCAGMMPRSNCSMG